MIRLYLDENVPEAIATGLRLRGYDVMTVKEANRRGLSDIEQLRYAVSEKWAVFTFNIADFCKLHSELIRKGSTHEGIILSAQLPIGVVVKRLVKILGRMKSDEIRNKVVWLSDYI